jgi:hypothetical protein
MAKLKFQSAGSREHTSEKRPGRRSQRAKRRQENREQRAASHRACGQSGTPNIAF